MKFATAWRTLCACTLLSALIPVSRAAAITFAAQRDAAVLG